MNQVSGQKENHPPRFQSRTMRINKLRWRIGLHVLIFCTTLVFISYVFPFLFFFLYSTFTSSSFALLSPRSFFLSCSPNTLTQRHSRLLYTGLGMVEAKHASL